MKWEHLDPYSLRRWLEETGTVEWEATTQRWTLVQSVGGHYFVLDRRYPWSNDAIPVTVKQTADGPVWLIRSRVPAYVRRVVERRVPAFVVLATPDSSVDVLSATDRATA